MADDLEVLTLVNNNLVATTNDPRIPLDPLLFDQASLVLAHSPDISDEARRSLIIKSAECLPLLQQDASIVTGLLDKLLEVHTYNDITCLLPNTSLTKGLEVDKNMVPINSLVLTILEKAASSAVDAALVATSLDVIPAVINLWLNTGDAGIADRASRVLINLLRVDQERPSADSDGAPSGGQGMVWKRIFGDQNVYASIFEPCAVANESTSRSKNQITLSQARLMAWLPHVGRLNWNVISKSQHAQKEEPYDAESLLDFAALKMVDYRDDVLMYATLIEFYTALLSCTEPLIGPPQSTTSDSPALRYLLTHDIHTRLVGICLRSKEFMTDPFEAQLLPGPATGYVSTYAHFYPDHFLGSDLQDQVLDHLRLAFDISPGQWTHPQMSPLKELQLLAFLPRKALLRNLQATEWHQNPLSLLSCSIPSANMINCLAAIFRGPLAAEIRFPPVSAQADTMTRDKVEASQARALYYHYLAYNPLLFKHLARHADTVALKDSALAAINVIKSIITANWATSEGSSILPNDIATPETGWQAILAPPALEYTMPYLLAPPISFAHIVGGRGHAESAAYEVGAAKLDALEALVAKLSEAVRATPNQGYEQILTQVSHALSRGWSREGIEVGARIATMDL